MRIADALATFAKLGKDACSCDAPWTGYPMQSKALFVTLQARPGEGETVAQWLRGSIEPIEAEPGTRDWYALRFGPDSFAIFDTFDGHRGRLTHLLGKVGRGLVVRTFTLLGGVPQIAMADIIASRTASEHDGLTTAVRSELTACDGETASVALALRDEMAEPPGDNAARYALRTQGDSFLLLDFLPPTTTVPPTMRVTSRLARFCRKVAEPARAEVLAYKLA
jgi:hypothetical protein